MPEDSLRVEYQRVTSSPTCFQPARHCQRCLLGASDKTRDMIRHPRQKPAWFHRSNHSGVKLPGLDVAEVGGDADHQMDQLQKVQEWLRRSYKHPAAPPRKPLESKLVKPKPAVLPRISADPKTKSTKASINVNKANMVDYADCEQFRYLKTLVPSILPNDIDIEKYLERQSRWYHGRTGDFTRYMSPEGKHRFRPQVGPIQRPHTPGKHPALSRASQAEQNRSRAEAEVKLQARREQAERFAAESDSPVNYALPSRSAGFSPPEE